VSLIWKTTFTFGIGLPPSVTVATRMCCVFVGLVAFGGVKTRESGGWASQRFVAVV
jgi:hypothetical protein